MAELTIFVPCFVDQLRSEAGIAATRLLEALGHRVELAEAVCCGQVLGNAGEQEEATQLHRIWERAHARARTVLVLGESCLGEIDRQRGQAASTGSPQEPVLVGFAEWMLRHGPSRYPRRLDRIVALHHSCSSMHETRSAGATRSLLQRVEGIDLREAARLDECCGFGGSFASSFPELSVRMGRDKLEELGIGAADPGGEVAELVSTDLSCLLHLQGLAPEGLPCRHLAELLWEACA